MRKLLLLLFLSSPLFSQTNYPNINCTLPVHGALNWDVQVKNCFAQVDVGVILKNPIADQTITSGFDLNIASGGGLTALSGTNSLGIRSSAGGATLTFAGTGVSSAIIFNTAGGINIAPNAGQQLSVSNGPLALTGASATPDSFSCAIAPHGICGMSTRFPIMIGGNSSGGVILYAQDAGATDAIGLPDQSGKLLTDALLSPSLPVCTNGSKYLTTTACAGGGGTPGGSNTNLQYNNAGAFGGFADGTSTQILHGQRTFGPLNFSTDSLSGTLPATQMPALTGDCTTVVGAVAVTCGAAIGRVANRIDQNNAATTSTQFFSIISDETGTGSVVGSNAPSFSPGTITTDINPLNVTWTTNNAATTFTGLKFAVTNTAQNAGSFNYKFCGGSSAATCVTFDTAANLVTPGTGTFGNGSAVAGQVSIIQGTAATAVVNAWNFTAPTTVTGSPQVILPGAAATGIPHLANSAGVMTETISAVDLSSADATGLLAAARVPSAHVLQGPLLCLDSSGSGTAQSCTTSPSFTPAAGDTIIYKTTTANTGSLTINVNSSSAVTAKKWQGTANLASGDLKAGIYMLVTYDGTNWEFYTIGNAPSGGGSSAGQLFAFPIQAAQGASSQFVYCVACPGGGSAVVANEARIQTPVPIAGTLKNLMMWVNQASNAQPGTGNLVVAVRVNGADTAVTFTIASGATVTTVQSDTTHTVAVSQGDLITLGVTNNATSGSLNLGQVTFVVQ